MPNCFCGFADVYNNFARFPTIAVGAANYCFEFWHRVHRTQSPFSDETATVGFTLGGVADTQHRAGARMEIWTDGSDARLLYDGAFPAAPGLVTAFWTTTPGWHYFAVNVDRAGNITLYRDGVNIAAVAIDNVNQGTLPFLPWVGADWDANTVWSDWHAAVNEDHFNGIIGPVAVHTGTLLTDAQMALSMAQRYPRNIAQTQLLYDWRRVLNLTGWEGNPANIINGISRYSTIPIAAPEGTDNTVVVPDLSGNGNDWTLTTRAAYNSTGIGVFTLTGLSCLAFGSDSYFQQGGLS
jgi:hypothetical protein